MLAGKKTSKTWCWHVVQDKWMKRTASWILSNTLNPSVSLGILILSRRQHRNLPSVLKIACNEPMCQFWIARNARDRLSLSSQVNEMHRMEKIWEDNVWLQLWASMQFTTSTTGAVNALSNEVRVATSFHFALTFTLSVVVQWSNKRLHT